MHLRVSLGLAAALLLVGIGGCAWLRPDQALRVATGTTAHDLCSETFVAGLDPDRAYAESLKPRPGYWLVAPLVRYSVDREHGEVRASLAGVFPSRAIYRGALGCTLVRRAAERAPADGPAPAPREPPMRAAAALAALPEAPAPAGVQAAVDEAFRENVPGALRQTKAVVVVHGGHIIAERYAPGYGAAAPILGFSLSKSVTNALVGMLVREGKLRLDRPLPLASTGPEAVTLEHAMRMVTGLDLDETGSGFDPANRLLYVHTEDMAAFAMRARRIAPPDRRWAYSSASTHLVARQVRDALGDGEGVQRFARERLFRPLGMEHVTIESDETGTPIGAHYMLASARDWARFGLLYLHDGVAPGGERLLPEQWVRWSTTPTLDTDYGAGWWVNRRSGGAGPGYDMPLMPDVPADAFYGLGNLGQWVVVVPSRDLVVVRLGRAHTRDFDAEGVNRLVAATLAALPH